MTLATADNVAFFALFVMQKLPLFVVFWVPPTRESQVKNVENHVYLKVLKTYVTENITRVHVSVSRVIKV